MFLTFDIGTTALKTALIAGDGRVVGLHTEEYTFSSDQPDTAEMNPETYWGAAVSGARSVLLQSGADSSEVLAIGFSSQGQTFVPLDSKGRTLTPAIVWTDKRASEIAARWEAEWLTKDDFRRISGYPWLPSELTVFKVAWLAEHSPEAHRAWKFLCLPDYLIYRMTGETVTDHVTAQFSGFYDIVANRWEHRMLASAGISEGQLPEVMQSGSRVGALLPGAADELGVPAGVMVCLGANDQIAGAVGAGNVRPGLVSETTGTALAVAATTNELLDDGHVLVGRHAVADRFYALAFVNTSAVVLKWFRDICAPGEDYESFVSGVESISPGCDGLTVLPHFEGTHWPVSAPSSRGAVAGLCLGHGRAHIARAIMEACACELQDCVDLLRNAGVQPGSVRSLGGAARNALWLQMKADMLGIPVERPACPHAAPLGAAMLAAFGIGQFRSIEEASEAFYAPSATFEPREELHSSYLDVYSRYRDLCARLYS